MPKIWTKDMTSLLQIGTDLINLDNVLTIEPMRYDTGSETQYFLRVCFVGKVESRYFAESEEKLMESMANIRSVFNAKNIHQKPYNPSVKPPKDLEATDLREVKTFGF